MKKQAFNPFLPLDTYIPDGEPHVFGDRVYLFGSHDKEAGETYCMLDYMGWSAPVKDLSDWQCSGVIYCARQDPMYSEKRPYLYAPDVVRGNDGKFYLYYCLAGFAGKGGYDGPIGVAVCDTPDGKYEYLGFVRHPDGSPYLRNILFDPAVINDSGTIRLYYGASMILEPPPGPLGREIYYKAMEGIFSKTKEEIRTPPGICGANEVELEDDMLTVRGEAKRVLPGVCRGTGFEGHGFFEGASIRRIGELYYLIYSSVHGHELCYAVSRYPDRDFAFRGVIVSNGDIGLHGRKAKDRLNATGNNHGSIEKIGDRWYVFYHRQTHGSDYSRQACAEPIEIRPDGTIEQVEMTSCGLNGGPLRSEGEYPAVICCNLTNGHLPPNGNRVSKRPQPRISSADGERFIRDIDRGTWVGYKYFDFRNVSGVTLTLRGGAGSVAVYDALNGKLLGSTVFSASERWRPVYVRLHAPNGKSALFFRFETKRQKTDFLKFAFETGEGGR